MTFTLWRLGVFYRTDVDGEVQIETKFLAGTGSFHLMDHWRYLGAGFWWRQ